MARMESQSPKVTARFRFSQFCPQQGLHGFESFITRHEGHVLAGPTIDGPYTAYSVRSPRAVIERAGRMVHSGVSFWKHVVSITLHNHEHDPLHDQHHDPDHQPDQDSNSKHQEHNNIHLEIIRADFRGYRETGAWYDDLMREFSRREANVIRERSHYDPDGFLHVDLLVEISHHKLQELEHAVKNRTFFNDLDPVIYHLDKNHPRHNEKDRYYLRFDGAASQPGLKQSILDDLVGVIRPVGADVSELYPMHDDESGRWQGDITFEWVGFGEQPDPHLIQNIISEWRQRHGIPLEVSIGRWHPVEPPSPDSHTESTHD